MPFLDNQNYIVFPAGERGPFPGLIEGVVQGSTGHTYNLYCKYGSGGSFTPSGTIEAHFWEINNDSTVYTVTGTISINGSDSTVLDWSPSAADVSRPGHYFLIITVDDKKSLPVEWHVYKDAAETTPPSVPTLLSSVIFSDVSVSDDTHTYKRAIDELGRMIIQYNGTTIARLDSSGNLAIAGTLSESETL